MGIDDACGEFAGEGIVQFFSGGFEVVDGFVDVAEIQGSDAVPDALDVELRFRLGSFAPASPPLRMTSLIIFRQVIHELADVAA